MDEERTRRRLKALVLAVGDMEDVVDAVIFLTTLPQDDLLGRIRHTVETGLFVTYARPFTQSRRGGLPKLNPPKELPDELRALHLDILERRDKTYAHTDDTLLRTVIELDAPDWRDQMHGEDLFYAMDIPTAEVLAPLRDRAHMNRQHFINQYLELEKRLAD